MKGLIKGNKTKSYLRKKVINFKLGFSSVIKHCSICSNTTSLLMHIVSRQKVDVTLVLVCWI